MLWLLVAMGAIVFCPHAGHEEAHAEVGVAVASADTCCEPVLCAEEETESHHDHGGCEFDAMHSHDFSVSVATTYVPVIRVVSILSYDVLASVAQSTRASRIMQPKIMGSPLQTLNCVRLLI